MLEMSTVSGGFPDYFTTMRIHAPVVRGPSAHGAINKINALPIISGFPAPKYIHAHFCYVRLRAAP